MRARVGARERRLGDGTRSAEATDSSAVDVTDRREATTSTGHASRARVGEEEYRRRVSAETGTSRSDSRGFCRVHSWIRVLEILLARTRVACIH